MSNQQERNQKIVELYQELGTLQKVSEVVGLTPEGVRLILKQNGIQRIYKRASKNPHPKIDKITKAKNRLWAKVDVKEDKNVCWFWIGKSIKRTGHLNVKFQGKCYGAHVLVWFFHHGYFSDKWILHDCGNASCCNPYHLKEGTPSENAIDRHKHANLKNELPPSTKLTKERVIKIKTWLRENAKTIAQIADECNVSYGTIWAIANNKSWNKVQIS